MMTGAEHVDSVVREHPWTRGRPELIDLAEACDASFEAFRRVESLTWGTPEHFDALEDARRESTRYLDAAIALEITPVRLADREYREA